MKVESGAGWSACGTTFSEIVGALSVGTTGAVADEFICAAQIGHELSPTLAATLEDNSRCAEVA